MRDDQGENVAPTSDEGDQSNINTETEDQPVTDVEAV